MSPFAAPMLSIEDARPWLALRLWTPIGAALWALTAIMTEAMR